MHTGQRLYELLEQRLQAQGETLPCAMDALKVYTEANRCQIDFLQLAGLDNRSFFDACYLLAFNMYPPAPYLEQWSGDIQQLPREEFQRKFINSFMLLPKITQLHVHLKNCIYMDGSGKRKTAQVYGAYRMLYPVFSRLPLPLRERLKKLMWLVLFSGRRKKK